MKCTFCSKDIPLGTGNIFIKKTGKIFYYCSSKCDKNMNVLKRNPTKLKWALKKKK